MHQRSRLQQSALPILLVALLLSPAQAQSQSDSRHRILSIDPALCVLTSEQTQCDTPLLIRWQLPPEESTTICLYIAEQAEPLFCEYSNTNGEHHLQLLLDHNTEFELRRQNELIVLARATVTIARQLSDLRPRRRHGWGIF